MKRWLLWLGVLAAGIAGAAVLLQLGDEAREEGNVAAILDRAGDVQGELEECVFSGRPPPEWRLGAAAGAIRGGRDFWQPCAEAALERFEKARAGVDSLNAPASEFRDSLMNFRFHAHPDKEEGSGATPAEICASVAELRRRYDALVRAAKREPDPIEEPSCEGPRDGEPALFRAPSPAPGVEYVDYVVRGSGGERFAHFEGARDERAIARFSGAGWERLELPEMALPTSLSALGLKPALILRGSPQRIAALEDGAFKVVAELPDSLLAEAVRVIDAGPLVVARELKGERRLVVLRPSAGGALSPPVALTAPLSELPQCDPEIFDDGAVRALCHTESLEADVLVSYFLPAGSDEVTHQRLTERKKDGAIVSLRTCASDEAVWALFGASGEKEAGRSLYASGDRGASWAEKGSIAGKGGLHCAGDRLLWLGEMPKKRGLWQRLCPLKGDCTEPELLATVGRSYVARDGSMLVQRPTGLGVVDDQEWALLYELGKTGLEAARLVPVADREGVENVWQLGDRFLRRR